MPALVQRARVRVQHRFRDGPHRHQHDADVARAEKGEARLDRPLRHGEGLCASRGRLCGRARARARAREGGRFKTATVVSTSKSKRLLLSRRVLVVVGRARRLFAESVGGV
jgi:hypothetical protein